MSPRVLLVGGLAIVLLAVGCKDQERSWVDERPPREEMGDDRATRAEEEAQLYATDVARERAAWDRAVRDCIRAGNSETLCKFDPYNPYGQE